MHKFGQRAEGSDQADVVGVIVDHHPGIGPLPVQFGVDVNGGRDVPASADHHRRRYRGWWSNAYSTVIDCPALASRGTGESTRAPRRCWTCLPSLSPIANGARSSTPQSTWYGADAVWDPTPSSLWAHYVSSTKCAKGAGEAIFVISRCAGWIAHAFEVYNR